MSHEERNRSEYECVLVGPQLYPERNRRNAAPLLEEACK